VDAISEQIIPGDQDPGAHDAGVVNFIDKQLASRYRRHRQTYRDGLRGVDETSHAMFKHEFVALTLAQQIEVLKALESGKAKGDTWRKQSAGDFFRLIRDHTMQGFYGGPQHGGNRGYASYKMLGIDYPQIIGQNRYRRK
jgi:gluconate 2-dehydrogenase gamma chain